MDTQERNNMVLDPDVMFEDLVRKIKENAPNMDLNRIRAAYEMARSAHSGQKRRDGSPYVTHCIAAADISVDIGLDEDSIIAALLHDVIEDTSLTHEDIARQFGNAVADIVEGVTKLTRVQYTSKEDEQAENLRKMLLAMAKDIRVILIKIADRLHNMRTMAYQTPEKQKTKSLETMEIYAPIAHRLGMQRAKWELEDLSLQYLDPEGYKEITDNLNRRMPELERFMDSMKEKIQTRLEAEGVQCTIYCRIKHVYSIYRKMYAQKLDINGIFDLCAFRVIVDSIPDCYNVLGIIHDMFKPVPGRFKDYISTPKPNMYQSVHTTVIGSEGIPFEVQIRTRDMHLTAEFGVAAHWKYKTGKAAEGGNKVFEDTVTWIRKMIEDQMDSESADVIDVIKEDIMPEEIYVFTPKGEIKVLPRGSTVIDFAYAIHSQVGHRMIGAKIDGRIVPLNTVLHTGNKIEIQTTKEITNGPSRDWLNMAKTSQAKTKIRSWFKNERRTENIEEGKAEFEREMKRAGLVLPDDKFDEFMQEQIRKSHKDSIDDFYAAIGYGAIVVTKLMPRLREDYARIVVKPMGLQGIEGNFAQEEHRHPKGDPGVRVEGIDNCQIKMSRCCNPLPGDEIIGFITRGFGVSVHKRSCPNVPENIEGCENHERWIKVYWSEGTNYREFKTTLRLFCLNRKGLLADVTTQLSMMHISISMLNSRELKDDNAVITATISVSSKEHLAQITSRLSRISGVLSIE